MYSGTVKWVGADFWLVSENLNHQKNPQYLFPDQRRSRFLGRRCPPKSRPIRCHYLDLWCYFLLSISTLAFMYFNNEGQHEVLDLLGGTLLEDSTKNVRQAQNDTKVRKWWYFDLKVSIWHRNRNWCVLMPVIAMKETWWSESLLTMQRIILSSQTITINLANTLIQKRSTLSLHQVWDFPGKSFVTLTCRYQLALYHLTHLLSHLLSLRKTQYRPWSLPNALRSWSELLCLIYLFFFFCYTSGNRKING